MQLVDVDPHSLTPAPYNPRFMRDHEGRNLVRSLQDDGFLENVVVNRRTGHIVSGHMRVEAAKTANLATVPVHYIDVDEVRERQINLHMNRTRGEWDDQGVLDLLEELDRQGADLTLTGFAGGELEALFLDLEQATMAPVDAEDRIQAGMTMKQSPYVKVVLAVPDLSTCEAAIAAVGDANRGAAFATICRHYLDTKPSGEKG